MGGYLICLTVGGVLFGLSLLGGADHDLGGHGLGGHDVGGHDLAADHPGTGDIAPWFTLRALVSLATFSGLAGVLGGLIGASVTAQFVMALTCGLVVGGFTAYLFRLATGPTGDWADWRGAPARCWSRPRRGVRAGWR